MWKHAPYTRSLKSHVVLRLSKYLLQFFFCFVCRFVVSKQKRHTVIIFPLSIFIWCFFSPAFRWPWTISRKIYVQFICKHIYMLTMVIWCLFGQTFMASKKYKINCTVAICCWIWWVVVLSINWLLLISFIYLVHYSLIWTEQVPRCGAILWIHSWNSSVTCHFFLMNLKSLA